MAFGSWIKNIVKKVGNFITKKVIPVAKKVGNVVKKVVAPVIQTAGGLIGGSKGEIIKHIGDVAGSAADKTISVSDKIDDYLKKRQVPETDAFKRQQMINNLNKIKFV